MSEKQGLASKDKNKKDWGIDKFFNCVREASLKDPVVASYAADLNKQTETKEPADCKVSSNKPIAANFATYPNKRVVNKKGQGTGKAKKWKYQQVKAKKWKPWGVNPTCYARRWWRPNRIERLKLKDVEVGDCYYLFNCPVGSCKDFHEVPWHAERWKILSINIDRRLTVQGSGNKEIKSILVSKLRKPDYHSIPSGFNPRDGWNPRPQCCDTYIKHKFK